MSFPLDRRTRRFADVRDLRAAEFFAIDFPALAAENGVLVARGMAALKPRPLAVEVGDDAWTVTVDDGTVIAAPGVASGALVVTLGEDQFSDWAQDQRSFNALTMGRELQYRGGDERDISIWDSLWRALLDGWPVVDNLDFLDRDGEPLDLTHWFAPEDDPSDIAHFLREAGFLHLRGWVDGELVARISAEIDVAVPNFSDGDGRSWWATVKDGSRRCVRIQDFLEYSPATVELLTSERWEHLRRTMAADDDLAKKPAEGRCIEALIKPVGVVAGASDLPFHRDCHFGRHAYTCSGAVVGVSVTASSEANGQLRVIPGSHRLAMPMLIATTEPYLDDLALPTEPGDLTVHLGCTLHASTAPQIAERKVMYGGFQLAPRPDAGEGSDKLSTLRENVYKILLDEAGATT